MSRNSSGTYTLPAGNPVTTGTSVSSSWANSTLSDIASELTNSLDRQGRGAMTGALQAAAGTVAAPGITFSSDTDTGLYHPAANQMTAVAGGASVMLFSSTIQAYKQLQVVNGTVAAPGLALAEDETTGIYSTTGGELRVALSGVNALTIEGATDTAAIALRTTITDPTGSTAAAPVNALTLANGNLKLSGTNPDSNVALTNSLTPYLIPKAAGYITTDGAGGKTIVNGQNIASVALFVTGIEITFAQPMASASGYCVVAGSAYSGSGSQSQAYWSRSASDATKAFIATATIAGAALDPTTTATAITFVVFGAQ